MAANNVGRSMLAIIVSIVTAGVIGTSFGATPAWAAPRGAGDPPRSAAGAVKVGNSIGTVGAPLQGNTVYRGKVATTSTDAWYHLYKAGRGTASIHFADTSGGAAPCPEIAINLDDADGSNGNVDFGTLNANGSTSFLVTAPGQYYIEITTWGCPTGNAGGSYSIKPKGTSAWTKGPVPPTPGTIKAGISIGQPSAPLQGHTLYTGRVANTSTDAWYQLYKTGNGTATLRFEDTTVSGSATCPDIGVNVDNADGTNGNVDFTTPGDNGAATIILTAPGQYYIEITSWGCPTGNAGATYSIEPEPSTRFSNGPTPPTPGTIKAGVSIGQPSAPLRGHTLYTGTVANTSTDAWYQLYKTGTGTATIRFKDTTISGSATCPDVGINVDNASGTSGNVDFTTPGDNGAATINLTAPGQYYIEITTWGCPTGNAGATYSIEPEPSSRFSNGPTPPTPGTTKPGASKNKVGSPLRGHELYRGKIAISSTQAWYQLNKASGSGTATIEFKDTTISGLSVTCPEIGINLYKGSQNVDFTTLNDNAAATLDVTTAGRYYIEIISWGCPTGNAGATYSVEPEPASGWTAAR
jgi:hypothetical protein